VILGLGLQQIVYKEEELVPENTGEKRQFM